MENVEGTTQDATGCATRSAAWDDTMIATSNALDCGTRIDTWDVTGYVPWTSTWDVTEDVTRDLLIRSLDSLEEAL